MARCPGHTIGRAALANQPADCCREGPWLSLYLSPPGAGLAELLFPRQALATAPLRTSRTWIPAGPGLPPWLAPLWLTERGNSWGSSAGGWRQLREPDLQTQASSPAWPCWGSRRPHRGPGRQGAHVMCGLNPAWMWKGNPGHQASHHEGL